MTNPTELTGLLQRWKQGDTGAEEQLVEAVYPMLRALAHKQLGSKQDSLTLQPTELAHEAYVRLLEQRNVDWQNRGHFFAIAARVVRRVVIDYLRERDAQKRGGDVQRIPIELVGEMELSGPEDSFDWLQLDQLLAELERVDPDSARVTEMRYFTGLSVADVAKALGVSESTVARQWRTARAWLHHRLSA